MGKFPPKWSTATISASTGACSLQAVTCKILII
jgi:hypothetical protein